MNVRIALYAILVIGALSALWYVSALRSDNAALTVSRDKWKGAAEAEHALNASKDRYIERINANQKARDAAENQNQKDADNVQNDGCTVLPASFRDFLGRMR